MRCHLRIVAYLFVFAHSEYGPHHTNIRSSLARYYHKSNTLLYTGQGVRQPARESSYSVTTNFSALPQGNITNYRCRQGCSRNHADRSFHYSSPLASQLERVTKSQFRLKSILDPKSILAHQIRLLPHIYSHRILNNHWLTPTTQNVPILLFFEVSSGK